MIIIKNFLPTKNFTRITFEFDDQKITRQVKNLSIEIKDEIQYSKIKIIRVNKAKDFQWIWNTFVLFMATLLVKSVLINTVLCNHIENNPITQAIEKLIVIIGLLLCIPFFHKEEFYSFLSADHNYLATIKANKRNRKLIKEAIDLIKQKTEILSESYPSKPFPEQLPILEIVEFDLPDFLNKITTRFYSDKLIESQKSLVGEEVTEINYDQLSGKVNVIRTAKNSWSSLGCLLLNFWCITITPVYIFIPPG
jgi:hypothetical protein